MKLQKMLFPLGIGIVGLVVGCGAVKDKAAEVSNGINVRGNWLMTESQHASTVERAVEKESVVLTFKDGKAAFSPTDSLKGKAVYATLSNCTAGPRPYHADKNDIVFDAVAGCPETRITVQQLDGGSLKFPDPSSPDITRTFVKIDDAHYEALVKASDRHL